MSVFEEMKANTEEMIAELEAAGYERFSKFHDKTLALKHPYEPDMMLWDDGLFFHSVSQAHEHLQEKRQFEAMQEELERLRNENVQFAEFTKQVADARVPSEWYTPAPYKYAFRRLKNNARALMVKLGKNGVVNS